MEPDLEAGEGGKVVWFYSRGSAPGHKGGAEVHSCELQPDGHVITAEAGSKRLVELDEQGQVVRTIPITGRHGVHHQFRLVRRTPRGTQLVACLGEGVVREVDAEGKVLRTVNVREAAKGKDSCGVYMATETPAGNWFISTSGLGCLIEVDAEGKVVWRFDGPVEDKPLRWPAGCELLANGNILVCDWKGRVCEVTREKEVVWVLPGGVCGGATGIVALGPDLRPLKTGAAAPAGGGEQVGEGADQ
jgi:hypothetical protein